MKLVFFEAIFLIGFGSLLPLVSMTIEIYRNVKFMDKPWLPVAFIGLLWVVGNITFFNNGQLYNQVFDVVLLMLPPLLWQVLVHLIFGPFIEYYVNGNMSRKSGNGFDEFARKIKLNFLPVKVLRGVYTV